SGVFYDPDGPLEGWRIVWLLARLPEKYIIAGDEMAPFLVVLNGYVGSAGVKVAMPPIRVVCQNTLNLALGQAKRIWSTRHTENVMSRVQEARDTILMANDYMRELGKEVHTLTGIKLSDRKVMEFMNEF